jgi:DNA mismatch endonuclease (patch repair protein)
VKFNAKVERDIRKEIELMVAGWEVLLIWECETKDKERLASTLLDFLGSPGHR